MSVSVLNKRTEKIFKYVEAYNQMDAKNMIADFSDDIIFKNVMNGEKTMVLRRSPISARENKSLSQ